MIKIWQIGNTGVRNPLRIHEAFRLYAESNLVGRIRGVEGSVAFMNYLCEKGVLANEQGKDKTGSYGRKWRLMFNANGFTYQEVRKGMGFSQADIGPVDEITPFGRAFLAAETVSAIQEFFLRSLSMHMEPMDDGRSFSPLRWTLAVLLELERVSGTGAVGFSEFAAFIQTSTPQYPIEDVVDKILNVREERRSAPSKKKYDKELFHLLGKDYPQSENNFREYGDMNIRYLKASGILRSSGKGMAIVAEKHAIAEMLVERLASDASALERYTELYNGPALPTDDFEAARQALLELERSLSERGMSPGVDWSRMTSAMAVNAERVKLESLIADDAEVEFAHRQHDKWEEISDYMALVMHRGGRKQYDDDTEISVPRDEVPAYLEWTVWRAFLAMNTLVNKPYEIRRFKIDQDFYPVGTAPGNGPDMIAEYDDCKIVIEVTMSDRSRQEAMEGEPVRRHVYDVLKSCGKPVYGLFVANRVNTNTAETFRVGTWYSNDDERTRLNIVPLTLEQFRDYFMATFNSGKHRNGEIVGFLDSCISRRDEGGAPEWRRSIAADLETAIRHVSSSGPKLHQDVSINFRFREYLPFYSLRAACGKFGDGEDVECKGWVKVEGCGRLDEEMFVVQASGRSMEPKIHDGDLCVMRANPEGTRQGKIVLAEHRGIEDPDTGGTYSIKKYSSEKFATEDGSWRHKEITLLPLNSDYEPIPISEDDGDSFRIVAEFLKVL